MSSMSVSAVGMSAALDRYDASAERTARMGTDRGKDVDPAAEAVSQMSDRTAFEANAAALRVSSTMNKHLLDIMV